MEISTYIAFSLAALILVLVPGPDMAFMLTRTIAQGQRAGIQAALGINAGAYFHVLLTVLGVSAALAASPLAFTTLKWLGAMYLVFIGFQSLKPTLNKDDGSYDIKAPISGREIFIQGFISDALNPKVAVFYISFLPQFVDSHSTSISVTSQLLILGITCNVIALGVNIILVRFAGSATGRLRANPAYRLWLNRLLGISFIALGARLLHEEL